MVQLTSTAGSYQSPQSNASDSDSDYSSDLTNTLIFKEKWKSKENRLRSTSLVGKLNGWNLIPVIVKSNDDLRQEQIASQLIRFLSLILDDSQYVPNKLRAYSIIALTPDSGLIEAIPNTVSIDVLRRKEFGYGSLIDFFERYFDRDNTKSKRFQHAQENFIVSLANYSIVCYLLHLKDRHNGNILITTQGQLIHIDFGFLLAKTPGGNLDFEKAPFKLTREYLEIMGGETSREFQRFREVCVQTFLELRRHYQRILLFLETLSKGNEHLACFDGDPQRTIEDLKARFYPAMNDRAAEDMVHQLINRSIDHWTTNAYDHYQRLCQGIL